MENADAEILLEQSWAEFSDGMDGQAIDRGEVYAVFMNTLRKPVYSLVDERDRMQFVIGELAGIIEAAISAGDWKVDGSCDPDLILQAAAKFRVPEQPLEALHGN